MSSLSFATVQSLINNLNDEDFLFCKKLGTLYFSIPQFEFLPIEDTPKPSFHCLESFNMQESSMQNSSY